MLVYEFFGEDEIFAKKSVTPEKQKSVTIRCDSREGGVLLQLNRQTLEQITT
jgi:hypothetical protein